MENQKRHRRLSIWISVVATVLLLTTGWAAIQFKWIRDRRAFRAAPEQTWMIDVPAGEELAVTDKFIARRQEIPENQRTVAPGALGVFGETGLQNLVVRVRKDDVRRTDAGKYALAAAHPRVHDAFRLFPEANIRVIWLDEDSRQVNYVDIENLNEL